MKTTTAIPLFFVTSSDAKGNELIQKRFDTFDKDAITNEIRTQLSAISNGSEVEYWKCDNKYAYMHLESYLKRDGKILRQLVKGDRVYYSKSKLFS